MLTLTLTLTLSLFNQSKNHLPPYLVADEKPYILTITHTATCAVFAHYVVDRPGTVTRKNKSFKTLLH
jgi:hypothetical protein